MVTYLLKKSYQLKDLKEIEFQDLWGDHGIFTTMWIYGSPPKILFFKEHMKNLLKSLKKYKISKTTIDKDINKLIKNNIDTKKNYNHLLRVALSKKIISISLRKRIKPKLNFTLKLVKLKRDKPQFKNLKYKQILKHLSKMDNSKSDIGLCSSKKIFETGTSNIFFVKKNKIYSPAKNCYKGITFKFFESKLKKIIKKEIMINSIGEYDEILLIGSGKGVASVKKIDKFKWERKSFIIFNLLNNYYLLAAKKNQKYK